MKKLFMTEDQKEIIQGLFKTQTKTYHALADEAGIGQRPDKFEDLDYVMAMDIINAHRGLLGLKK